MEYLAIFFAQKGKKTKKYEKIELRQAPSVLALNPL
jgi:hypothetical protein